jgi:3-hydroxyacyl-CoA dehydrogenase/enoyl-CoA hydratase/3-hydroxybutyryl-CoA epimerase
MIRTTLDADGVLLAVIDMPGRSMNVFSADLMDALDAVMTRVETDAGVRCVVLTSAKSSFLAGADLAMVRGFTDQAKVLGHEALFELCGRLGRQFVRLESSAKPWVAAVNGIALGGGLELAMACRARVVSNNNRIQLGLPEVKWGLLPGAGGTQRLPRLAGFEAGLDLLLTGRAMEPEEAVARGVFEAALPAAVLVESARTLALSLCGQPFDAARKFRHMTQANVPPHTPEVAQALARKHGVSDADYTRFPAYGVIIDCVLLGARQSLAEASATEMRQFLRLMVDPVAGQMVRTLFLNRQRAERALAAPDGLRIEHIHCGVLPSTLSIWADALAKSKLPVHEVDTLPPAMLGLQDSTGAGHRVVMACLGDVAATDTAPGWVQGVLSPPGPYGRVLEILGGPAPAAQALAALATRLGALPYRSEAAASVLTALQQIRGSGDMSPDTLDAQALAALDLWATGAIASPEWLDVAACVSGVTPAYCGGPFAHLWTHHERLASVLQSRHASAWARAEPVLRGACA